MENITIKHYYGDTLCDGATVARKHRLYVTNRWMFQEYKKAMSAINPTKNKGKLVSNGGGLTITGDNHGCGCTISSGVQRGR